MLNYNELVTVWAMFLFQGTFCILLVNPTILPYISSLGFITKGACKALLITTATNTKHLAVSTSLIVPYYHRGNKVIA